jgi:[ribosomal protein S18]-alanine N-acetyltransferase
MGGRYSFRAMDDADAREVADWRYEPPYDFYDPDADPEDLAELQSTERRRDAYFSARDDSGQLVGYFQFEQEDEVVEVGLGLRPDLTGRGLGLEFVLAGLEFARRRFQPRGFSLSVATFNERAIRLYERAGFQRGEIFVHHTNGADYEFLAMTRKA